MRVHSDPDAVCVYLLDSGSRHGTEHRTVELRHGRTRDKGDWRDAPHAPARPAQLDAGDHDVRLAGELYVLIGGVPLDEGSTNDRADIPDPTPRQRDVLIELCRPFFETPDGPAAPASNAEIASRLTPPIGHEQVSDLLSQMYRRYELERDHGAASRAPRRLRPPSSPRRPRRLLAAPSSRQPRRRHARERVGDHLRQVTLGLRGDPGEVREPHVRAGDVALVERQRRAQEDRRATDA